MFSGLAAVMLLSAALVPGLPPQKTAHDAQASPPPAPQAGAARAPQSQSAMERAIDLDFRGGSPSDLLAAIEKQSGVVPNVLVSDDAQRFPLPPMRLKGVFLQELIGGLGNLGERDGCRLQATRMGPTAWALLTVRTNPLRASRQTMIFDVKEILSQKLGIDDLVTAIQTGAEMQAEDEGLQLKFHQETQLLLATGSSKELGVVDEVIRALKKRLDQNAQKQPLQAVIAELKATVARLQNEVAHLKKQLDEGRESRRP